MKQATLLPALMFGAALVLTAQVATKAPEPANTPVNAKVAVKNKIDVVMVHGKSLEGNLEGDPADREVMIYLPPSYATSKTKRYPVVYFLHGYGATDKFYWDWMSVNESADKAMAAGGGVNEMILVHPDAHTKYDGSMYSNSPTTGDWETFLTKDLVAYVDSHYRTISNRDSRGLAGHSMGGYGAFRLAMKYPEVYSSVYPMSSCCLMNNPQPPGAGRGGAQAKGGDATKAPPADNAKAPAATADKGGKDKGGKGKGGGGGFANVTFAEGAAWSPNPKSPQFFDLPNGTDGTFHPEIAAKWVANSPLAMMDQYVTNMKKYHAIAMDCGLSDTLIGSNRQIDALMTQLDIPHTFETYDGDHMNHVKNRFQDKVLPFFSSNLRFAPTSSAKPAAKKKS